MADEQKKTENKLSQSQLIKRALNEPRLAEGKNDCYTLIEKTRGKTTGFCNRFSIYSASDPTTSSEEGASN